MKLKNYKPLDTDKIMKQLHNGKVVSEKQAEYDGQHELQVCVFPQKADFT